MNERIFGLSNSNNDCASIKSGVGKIELCLCSTKTANGFNKLKLYLFAHIFQTWIIIASRYRCPSLKQHLVITEQVWFGGEQNQIWFSVCYTPAIFRSLFFISFSLRGSPFEIGEGLKNGLNPIKLIICLCLPS